MGKPPSLAKVAIKGTRNNDTILVDGNNVNVTTNGVTKTTILTTEQVAAGLLLKGDAGNDTITGGSGPDEIDGGGGDDTITGGDGADKLLGGAGDDRFIDSPLDSTFDGGRGFDTLDLSGSPVAIAVGLDGIVYTQFDVTRASDGYLYFNENVTTSRENVVRNVEELIGSAYNDWLIGNGLENFLRGGGGDDIISGYGSVGSETDHLFGDGGNDYLAAGGGNDELTGGSGADTFLFNASDHGDYVVTDFNEAEGDLAVIQLFSGSVTWSPVSHDGLDSLRASYGDDSITFVGVTSVDDIALVTTTGLYPGG